ncbi:hypothetical protein ACFCVO_06950 [Agromyces sp. NPDC056379]|uniref:hypothetical protein n=1 Tax=unclassified Agromyces TaxID=2639701 RepID=UPI0035DBED7A
MSSIQKAVTPAQSAAILERGLDTVAGYVVRRADAEYADTPAELYRLHALGFAGSPFDPAGAIDVLILPVAPTMQFEDAIGGTERSELAKTGGAFLDRPPFLGTGFAPVDRAVPVWWLAPTRVSPGTELVRYHQTGATEVLATYVDVATGWEIAGAVTRLPVTPSLLVGTLAEVDGAYRACDLVGDLVVMLDAATGDRVESARRDVQRVFELQMLGSWNGLELRLVEQGSNAGEPIARCVYLGHDADIAEGLGLVKIEAGVYELVVLEAQLEGLRTTMLEVADLPATPSL